MLRKRETRRIFSERIARGNAASTCWSPNYRIAVREKETGSGNTAELKDKLLNEISQSDRFDTNISDVHCTTAVFLSLMP
jgi:hypothetical protein